MVPTVAFDEQLASRIREVVRDEAGVTEKRMFGGLAFLVDGKLAASASSKGGMLLRVDPADTEALLREPHVDRFEMRGRGMQGWLHVGEQAVGTDAALRQWVARGLAYARSLPG